MQVARMAVVAVLVATACGLVASCGRDDVQLGHSIAVGRCRAQLLYKAGRFFYGDIYLQMVDSNGTQTSLVHVTDIDMPPDQCDLMYLALGHDQIVRVFMSGNDRQPYESIAPVPAACLE